MTNTKSHAEQEFEILAKTQPDSPLLYFKQEIIALCEKFGDSGQSGSSAPFVSHIIAEAVKKLMLFRTLTPITGEDDEWMEVRDNMVQNKRDSRIFKEKDGRAYFLDAIIFEDETDVRFFGARKASDGSIITSYQYIKSFPFTPKTFIIDVVGDRIKDENQLKEVFEYYERA